MFISDSQDSLHILQPSPLDLKINVFPSYVSILVHILSCQFASFQSKLFCFNVMTMIDFIYLKVTDFTVFRHTVFIRLIGFITLNTRIPVAPT